MPVSLGKKFEALIASQLDDCGVCFDRFKDDTAGYKGIRNICDFVVFFNGYLIYIECKTIHGKSFNFKNLTDNQYFYAQGNPTALAQIPTAGKVEYDGGAAYKKDGDDSQRTGMTATADFANKVIDINIKEKPNFVPGMNFGGKITGNSFAGEVNGIKTQGGFFGENAQEMTGLFTNEADQSRGAFGGIKQ